MEIQAEIEEFVEKRDRVVHKSPRGYRHAYQAVHKKSKYGNYPSCHIRTPYSNLTESEDEVDCRFCLKEYGG